MTITRIPFRFLLRLSLFVMPFVLYFIPTLTLIALSRESTSPEQVAQMQIDNPALIYGRAYRDDFRVYKFISVQLRSPQVLALGSSRVMQFRSAMFKGGSSVFYNAGGAAANIYEVRSFLQQLNTDHLPDVLIIGLDQDWFHPADAVLARVYSPWTITSPPQSNFAEMINTTRALFLDLLNRKRPYDRIFGGTDPIYDGPAIGIDAITIGSGFRSDGSYLYGPLIHPTSYTPASMLDTSIPAVIERIRNNCCKFQYGDIPDEGAIQEVEALMQFSLENHINLVLFSPPYAPSIYDEIVASGKYGYMFETSARLAGLAESYDYPYFDFMNGTVFGTDDTFLDGPHGSEYTYLGMLLEMLKDPQSPLLRYTSVEDLNTIFQKANVHPFEVFGASVRVAG